VLLLILLIDIEFGIIEKYQVLLSGFLAIFAGSIVWMNGEANRKVQAEKDLDIKKEYRTYYAKEAREIAANAEINEESIYQSDQISRTEFPIITPFKNKFLTDLSHISFFSEDEVRLIADIEQYIYLANLDYQNFEAFIVNYGDKPFKTNFKKRDFCALDRLARHCGDLSKTLDNTRWKEWSL